MICQHSAAVSSWDEKWLRRRATPDDSAPVPLANLPNLHLAGVSRWRVGTDARLENKDKDKPT